ncbi:hypothetical protein F4825DRAFT_404847 [Nemania diffusa]|nr:hypothetical protein F4825DRAFT_404847 [Nemania diffusa]
MPSLKPLKRVARSIVGEVREAREEEDVGSGSSSTTKPEPNEVRENPWQGSTKRAFLRSLIITSKEKLGGGHRDGTSASTSASASIKSGHERATSSTVSETPYL